MWRQAFILVLLSASCNSSPNSPSTPDPTSEFDVIWNLSIDFDDIRARYGAQENFYSLCEQDRPLEELIASANAADWATVLVLSDRWLSSCPVDLDAHYLRAVALAETGYEAESEMHFRWFQGLMASVLGSGDGESPETAFVVISVSEEYSVMRALQFDYKSQLLLDGGIDALTAVDAYGEAITVYFWPKAHWSRLARELPDSE